MEVVTPTLDGDVLGFLARGEKAFTGREVSRGIGRSSHEGVRRVLERLVQQGIVVSERAGTGVLFQLNRQHLAAPWIEGLASLRLELISKLRDAAAAWETAPLGLILFGSAARGDAGVGSDLDFLVVRPNSVDPGDDQWRSQLAELEAKATAWTGNDARVLEYGEGEMGGLLGNEPVLDAALEEGVEIAGSLRQLTRMETTR
jgi:DNA-binding transcriptional ArsR family regulator